jgi:16S rRNA (adenine1518-N6/adenine1519-N6)-dimethyltransferase
LFYTEGLPRKLGQHFLISNAILQRLATAACGEDTPRTVEIGAGRGALTGHLLPRTAELHAIELDDKLSYQLKKRFVNEPKLHVHKADVLETDLSQWGEAVVLGNLPYYITSPIIERFLALDARFVTAVFLVQWEVAERLVAHPGTRAYGYLSVATQLVCDVELVCKVPPDAFDPPPKVYSGAVKFRRREEVTENLPELLTFVGRCFEHKRKTLRNNLRPFFGVAADELPEAGLRAEQLTIAQFKDLFARLSSLTK